MKHESNSSLETAGFGEPLTSHGYRASRGGLASINSIARGTKLQNHSSGRCLAQYFCSILSSARVSLQKSRTKGAGAYSGLRRRTSVVQFSMRILAMIVGFIGVIIAFIVYFLYLFLYFLGILVCITRNPIE